MAESQISGTSAAKLGTRRLQEIGNGFKQAATLMAAIELDLFSQIDAEPAELPEIARRIGLSEEAADQLIAACAAMELLEKRDGKFFNAPDVERYLVKGKLTYIGVWILSAKKSIDRWKDLAAILKGEKEPASRTFYDDAWSSTEAARQLHEATYNAGLASGHKLARIFDFTPYSLLLDLGGGSGCYCIAAASEYPNLKAIVFDYATVCSVAADFIAKAGLSDRITTHPGDLIKDEYPQGVDVILLCSNLPNFSKDEAQLIANKAYAALNPGGVMHIIGEALNDDRTGPLEPALWGLEEALVGSRGRAHSRSEVIGYLTNAGFGELEIADFVPGILTRFTGRKRN